MSTYRVRFKGQPPSSGRIIRAGHQWEAAKRFRLNESPEHDGRHILVDQVRPYGFGWTPIEEWEYDPDLEVVT